MQTEVETAVSQQERVKREGSLRRHLVRSRNGFGKHDPQIFIRSNETKFYLGKNHTWCEELTKAQCFRSALEAELFCRQRQFIRIELVVVRKERPPLTIPLTLP